MSTYLIEINADNRVIITTWQEGHAVIPDITKCTKCAIDSQPSLAQALTDARDVIMQYELNKP